MCPLTLSIEIALAFFFTLRFLYYYHLRMTVLVFYQAFIQCLLHSTDGKIYLEREYDLTVFLLTRISVQGHLSQDGIH